NSPAKSQELPRLPVLKPSVGHDLERIAKTPPLPLGEGWGEGKPSSESTEKTGSNSNHPHPRPLSRRTGEGGIME
ncbi:MAG TPA: hypothetical protein PLO20_01970, partial [Thermogutta sp.]|nr:hypothetical protein [Thermogutta sp.]